MNRAPLIPDRIDNPAPDHLEQVRRAGRHVAHFAAARRDAARALLHALHGLVALVAPYADIDLP